MIEHVLHAASAYETIVVASPDVARAIPERERCTIVPNLEPQLGMAHSLALAHAAAPPDAALLVFLGDKPLVTAKLAGQVAEAAASSGADVAFPERDGIGGHPVFFSTNARTKIGGTGDSLRGVRDEPSLRRLALPINDEGAYRDIDDPGALATLVE